MRKRFIIPIFTAILISLLLALQIFAANATANVNSATAKRGDTVTLSVSLAKGVKVGSGAVEVIYDSAVLELVKGEWNVSNTELTTFTGNKGAFAYSDGTEISGKIFTATFKVKSNAAFGASTVKMTVQLKDGSSVDISVTNNSGKVTVECKHSYSAWKSTNGTSHERTCSICGKKETGKHEYTNACDTSCNTCGHTRTITHSYKTSWSSDSKKHWHECSVCKVKKDEAAHTPGSAATETTPQTCTTCGYVIQKALGHTHKPTGDWLSDANSHWKDCSTCDERANEAEHVYDNSCDTSCNVCGYERAVEHKYSSEWSSDKDGHWHVCTVCGAKDNIASHVPGPEATEESPQLCTVCGYEIAPMKDHEHIYTGEYIKDADGHWKDCACGESSEKEVHVWDGGKIEKEPANDAPGLKVYTCTVCGYAKTVELELFESEVSEPEDTDDITDDIGSDTDNIPSDKDKQSGGFSFVWLIVGLAVGGAAGAGVTLAVTKKKR